VNGALAEIVESLDRNRVFTARLLGSGNMVVVFPMEEDTSRFLPCCYGYATTIRRAQAADLHHGCLYMKTLYHAAARGYGYVGVSRFRTQAGVFLFGKLRRSDFLPVRADHKEVELESEQVDRGYLSVGSEDEAGCGLGCAHGSASEMDAEFEDIGASANALDAIDFED
jgi:hypothetical protein